MWRLWDDWKRYSLLDREKAIQIRNANGDRSKKIDTKKRIYECIYNVCIYKSSIYEVNMPLY